MDIIDQAIYDLIHSFKGGAPALSAYLYSQYGYQVKPGTLMNKANPDQPHQITVRESILIQRAQNKVPLLSAQAHVLNHSIIPLGGFADTTDIEFLNTYTGLHKELGDLAGVIHSAFEDGKISRSEVRQVRQRAMASIKAILEMEQRIKALCDEPYNHNGYTL